MMVKCTVSKQWLCKACEYTGSRRHHMTYHIETKHLNLGKVNCLICGAISKNRKALERHVYRKHKETQGLEPDIY